MKKIFLTLFLFINSYPTLAFDEGMFEAFEDVQQMIKDPATVAKFADKGAMKEAFIIASFAEGQFNKDKARNFIYDYQNRFPDNKVDTNYLLQEAALMWSDQEFPQNDINEITTMAYELGLDFSGVPEAAKELRELESNDDNAELIKKVSQASGITRELGLRHLVNDGLTFDSTENRQNLMDELKLSPSTSNLLQSFIHHQINIDIFFNDKPSKEKEELIAMMIESYDGTYSSAEDNGNIPCMIAEDLLDSSALKNGHESMERPKIQKRLKVLKAMQKKQISFNSPCLNKRTVDDMLTELANFPELPDYVQKELREINDFLFITEDDSAPKVDCTLHFYNLLDSLEPCNIATILWNLERDIRKAKKLEGVNVIHGYDASGTDNCSTIFELVQRNSTLYIEGKVTTSNKEYETKLRSSSYAKVLDKIKKLQDKYLQGQK